MQHSEKLAITDLCQNKPRHASKGKAEAAARSLDKRSGGRHSAVPCSNCGGWHTIHRAK